LRALKTIRSSPSAFLTTAALTGEVVEALKAAATSVAVAFSLTLIVTLGAGSFE
jgi:hypothetical protein